MAFGQSLTVSGMKQTAEINDYARSNLGQR
jgi:hypothetical protein